MQAATPIMEEMNLNKTNAFQNTPSGSLEKFILHLADSNLILSQRNAEWCGHGPILEQDIAITNISLDLLGQARNFYQYAAVLINKKTFNIAVDSKQPSGLEEATEDSLAYLRTEREFKNLLITELPKGDWAQTILRQFFFSIYQFGLYGQLQQSIDGQLAAIAEKSIKEVTYHVKWSSEWVIRLGDGTEESHKKMQQAVDNLWPYTGEFFIPEVYENTLINDSLMVALKAGWQSKVNEIFAEATLTVPENTYMQTGGKKGIHTEHLGFILAEMQYLQRTYPGTKW